MSIVSLSGLSYFLKGDFDKKNVHEKGGTLEPMGKWVFFMGIAALVFVPIFKVVTGLPPFMGMFFGLSILWIMTDIAHHGYDEEALAYDSSVYKN